MLTKADFKKGQRVYFGRERGEQTLGEITKLNPTKAVVKTLEERGNGRGSAPGAIWHVPYSMLKPTDDEAKPGDGVPLAPKEALKFNPFDEDNLLLDALVGVYNGLDPENLTADGELPFSRVKVRRAELQRKLKGIQYALGYDVDENQAIDWYLSKQEYNKKQTA